MQLYSEPVLNHRGEPVVGASVTVRTTAGALASLYAADGVTPIVPDSNGAIQTDSNGEVSFKAANGTYNLTISGHSVTARTKQIVLNDPGDLSAPSGAGLVGWLRSAVGAVATTLAKWIGWQDVCVYEFMTDAQIADAKARTLTLDMTAAIQAAIDHTSANGEILKLKGWLKTTDTLVMRKGTQIRGTNWFPSDWRVPAMATNKIKLVTAVVKDALVVDQASLDSGYVWGMHASGFTLEGSSIAGSRGIYLKKVASSVFSDIGISKFGRGVEIEFGMINEFNRINSSKNLEADYFLNGAAVTTTQTFNRCVGRESPQSWVMESTATGNSLGTTLNGCLVESTTVGGINQHKSCSAEYNSMYCENAPDDRVITNGTLFRLFKDGVDVDPYRSVAVFNGGDLAGGNFGLFSGSTLMDIGSAKHVSINGTEFQRATNGINWDATTADGAVHLNSPCFVQVTNLYTGPVNKMSGIYPDGNLTVARKNVITAEQMGIEGAWTAALVPAAGTITMGAVTGSYTKQGRNVTVSGLFTVASVSTPSGLLKLNGLPFTSATGFQSQSPAVVNAWYLTGVTTESITAVINPNTNYIEIDLFTNGSPQNAGSKITAGTQIHVSAIYPSA